MKDVVFQGTKKRKPGGMAEVVLHMVRDDDAFDIEESELGDIDEALSAIDDNAIDLEAVSYQHSAISPETNGFQAEDFEVEKVHAAQVGSIQTVERTIKTKRYWRPRAFALDLPPAKPFRLRGGYTFPARANTSSTAKTAGSAISRISLPERVCPVLITR